MPKKEKLNTIENHLWDRREKAFFTKRGFSSKPYMDWGS